MQPWYLLPRVMLLHSSTYLRTTFQLPTMMPFFYARDSAKLVYFHVLLAKLKTRIIIIQTCLNSL